MSRVFYHLQILYLLRYTSTKPSETNCLWKIKNVHLLDKHMIHRNSHRLKALFLSALTCVCLGGRGRGRRELGSKQMME